MCLVRLLYFCAACYNIHIMITHIADAISRFQMECFRTLAPAAYLQPDPIWALPTLSSVSFRDQCQSLGVAPSTWHIYQSGLRSFYSFCEKYRIHPLPASSLTLQFFCIEVSSHVSYKSKCIFKINLTKGELLCLVCQLLCMHHQQNNMRDCNYQNQ